jgi:hypothetical protein
MLGLSQKETVRRNCKEPSGNGRLFLLPGRPMSRNDEHVEGEEETTDRAALIRKAIGLFEDKIKDEKMKITAGEYIRLLELLKELDEEKPKEIRIRWVAEKETEPST